MSFLITRAAALIKSLSDPLTLLRRALPKTSQWRFHSSSSKSVSADPLLGEGPGVDAQLSQIVLERDGQRCKLNYKAAGLSFGAQIPGDVLSFGFSTEDFPSAGTILIPPWATDFESPSKFGGPYCAISVQQAIGIAATGDAMLIGMDPKFLPDLIKYLTAYNKVWAHLAKGCWDLRLDTVGSAKSLEKGLLWLAELEELVVQSIVDRGTFLVRMATTKFFRGVLFMASGSMTWSVVTQAHISASLSAQAGWITVSQD